MGSAPTVAPAGPMSTADHPDRVMSEPNAAGDAGPVGAQECRSSGGPPAPGTRSTGVEGELASVHGRLLVDHPHLDPDHLAALLHEAYAATADAKVQTYRTVLAERSARAQLRQRRHPTPDLHGSADQLPGDPA